MFSPFVVFLYAQNSLMWAVTQWGCPGRRTSGAQLQAGWCCSGAATSSEGTWWGLTGLAQLAKVFVGNMGDSAAAAHTWVSQERAAWTIYHFAIGPASFAWPWKQRARRKWSRWWQRPCDGQPQSALAFPLPHDNDTYEMFQCSINLWVTAVISL